MTVNHDFEPKKVAFLLICFSCPLNKSRDRRAKIKVNTDSLHTFRYRRPAVPLLPSHGLARTAGLFLGRPPYIIRGYTI